MSESSNQVSDLLARLIPGYSGYKNARQRQQDDQLTRDYLVRRLQECKNLLHQHSERLLQGGKWEQIRPLEELRLKLDARQELWRSIPAAEASLWSSRKVGEKEALQLSQWDGDTILLIDQLQTELIKTDPATIDWTECNLLVGRIEERWTKRRQLLVELGR